MLTSCLKGSVLTVEASGYYKEKIAKFADFLIETPIRKHYEVSILEPVRELTG
jgi:hypothetical protein